VTGHILSVLVLPQARQRFEQAGGVVMEHTAVQGATVHPDGVAMRLPAQQHADGASERVLHSVDAAICHAPMLSAFCLRTSVSTVQGGKKCAFKRATSSAFWCTAQCSVDSCMADQRDA